MAVLENLINDEYARFLIIFISTIVIVIISYLILLRCLIKSNKLDNTESKRLDNFLKGIEINYEPIVELFVKPSGIFFENHILRGEPLLDDSEENESKNPYKKKILRCEKIYDIRLQEKSKEIMRRKMTGRVFTSEWKQRISRSVSKLKDNQVREIKLMLDEGISQYIIAEQFDVHQSTISNINCNKCYQHIKLDKNEYSRISALSSK